MPFPLDPRHVKDAQGRLGVVFPHGFVSVMLRDNGGAVSTPTDYWQIHPFHDPSTRTRLRRTCNDIVRETRLARDRPGFPPGGVAIGTNGGGDVLLFLPRPDDAGRLADAVFWWDHETDDLHLVADDFLGLRCDPGA
jgi:hypothetical protein